MTKLESYQLGGASWRRCSTPTSKAIRKIRRLKRALEELAYFSSELKILGTYPASAYRAQAAKNGSDD